MTMSLRGEIEAVLMLNGGPVHPVILPDPDAPGKTFGTPGITMREHYACHAMQSLLMLMGPHDMMSVASSAFVAADCMIKIGAMSQPQLEEFLMERLAKVGKPA